MSLVDKISGINSRLEKISMERVTTPTLRGTTEISTSLEFSPVGMREDKRAILIRSTLEVKPVGEAKFIKNIEIKIAFQVKLTAEPTEQEIQEFMKDEKTLNAHFTPIIELIMNGVLKDMNLSPMNLRSSK